MDVSSSVEAREVAAVAYISKERDLGELAEAIRAATHRLITTYQLNTVVAATSGGVAPA